MTELLTSPGTGGAAAEPSPPATTSPSPGLPSLQQPRPAGRGLPAHLPGRGLCARQQRQQPGHLQLQVGGRIHGEFRVEDFYPKP